MPKRSSDDIVWMANNISCIMHGVTFSKKKDSVFENFLKISDFFDWKEQ